MARRRDVRGAAGGRRRAVHDGPRRARGRRPTSAGPARSCTSGSAARPTTTRRSTRGRAGSCRSSTTGWTPTSCSATTRTARAPLRAEAFAARVDRVARRGLTARDRRRGSAGRAREPSAGPNTTISRSVLGDVVEPVRARAAATNSVSPGPTSRVSSPAVNRRAAGEDHVDLVLGVRLLAVDGAGLEHVQPDRQVGHAEELEVRVAGGRLARRRASARVKASIRLRYAVPMRHRHPVPFRVRGPRLALLVAACGVGPADAVAAAGRAAARDRAAVADRHRRAVRGRARRPDAPPPAVGDRPDLAAASVALEPVVDGLDSPLWVDAAGDGSGRLFVAEQGGVIRIVEDGAAPRAPFLDITDRVTAGGERGLLGRRVPARLRDRTDQSSSSTTRTATGDTTIARVPRSPAATRSRRPRHRAASCSPSPSRTPTTTAAGSASTRRDAPHRPGRRRRRRRPREPRLGPRRAAGQDPADRRPEPPAASRTRSRPTTRSSDRPAPARRSSTTACATRSATASTPRPATCGSATSARARGRRSTSRRPARRGLDFGWRRWEGRHCFDPPTGCDPDRRDDARHASTRTRLGCSVIGGVVYRGDAIPALRGAYLFSDYCCGTLWAIDAGLDGAAGADRSCSRPARASARSGSTRRARSS